MAELAGGLIGAGASLAAVAYARSSGFCGRHECSHRAELASLDGSTSRFSVSLENGTATEDDEESFRIMWHDARQKNLEYYESINEYKDVAWIKLAIKLKLRKAVRKKKRSARDSNHSLRHHVEDVASSYYSYSDNASVYATSGSPPGSALGKEFISEWRDRLHVAASWNDYNESLPILDELDDLIDSPPKGSSTPPDYNVDTPDCHLLHVQTPAPDTDKVMEDTNSFDRQFRKDFDDDELLDAFLQLL